MYIAILGRQPTLGMAELEHLYGADNTRWFSDQSALVETDAFSIDRLGGIQKAGRVVTELARSNWRQTSTKIVQSYTQAWADFDGKITLGISAYGFDISPRDVQKTGIILKQKLKKSGVSLRLVPNAETYLSTATAHHNKLGLSDNKIELIIVRARNGRVIVAESTGSQNITALARRDQGRPKRDAFVGMLPPKLAQIMINLAIPYRSLPHPSPPPGHSTGGIASPWRSARPDGDIPSNEQDAKARQRRGIALSVSSRLATTMSKHLQPELEATSGPEFKPGAKPFTISGGRNGEQNNTPRILDPFCGTGVILQEAALMGYAVYGTDLSDKMVDYSRANLEWLANSHHLSINATIEQADATDTTWQQPIDAVVCESYLGQPFSAPPSAVKLDQVRKNCDHIITSFLTNLARQIASGTPLCIAVPAWKNTAGHFTHLPFINRLLDLGYTEYAFKHVSKDELLYYREDQVVARELLVLVKS